MKNYFFILLFFVCNFVFAQKEEKIRPGKPINTGFVFIDGKYIEPPYYVKRKGLAVYINGIQITKEFKQEKNPFTYNHHLGIPPCLNKNSSLDDIIKCKEPFENLPYLAAMTQYYYKNYEYYTAIDSIAAYIRSFPNIKRLEKNGDLWVLESYLGEIENYSIGGMSALKKSKMWGPNGTGPKPKKEIMGFVDNIVESRKYALRTNDVLIIFSNFESHTNLLSIGRTEDDLPYIYKIMNSNYSNNDKIDSLVKLFGSRNKDNIKKFVEGFKVSPQFHERIKLAGYDKMKTNMGKPKSTGYKQSNKNKDKSSIAFYSPEKNEIYGWCGNIFEDEFNVFLTDELYNVKESIKFQSFIYNDNNVFYDDTPSDDDFGYCDYNNLVNMKNAGLLYFSGHGNTQGEFLVYATTQSSLQNWCNNNQDILIVHLLASDINNWNQSEDCWAAMAKPQWFDTNWKADLTQSNAIVVLSSCYSGTGIIEHVGGGVTFGYSETTQWGTTFQPGIKTNNNQLFNRMNGTIGNGQFREAISAFTNMTNHYHGFTYNSNNLITLCPASKSKYPDNGDSVGLQGDGYFEVDTYCDASIPINDQDFNNSPIAFEWTNSGLNITNVKWDDSDGDGLSNKIIYHWESTVNNTVTVKINHNYWQSAPSLNGQYHLLDYNKVTPNSEDGQYIFYISNTIPIQAPVADFSYTINNNTVNFQDQSTNTPTSWQWNFGDGQSSTLQNSQHTYSNAGTYYVTLTVSNQFGSSSKTKSVSITSTPQTVTVSGVVQNFDNFVPIAGATVSCSYASTTTNASGYYSLQVPYNVSNCGVITASAPGFQSSSTCSCNNLISDKSCDFKLKENEFYIEASPNNIGCEHIINFTAHNVPVDYYNYLWNFGDEFSSTSISSHPFFQYSSIGLYNVTLTITNGFGDNLISQCAVYITSCPQYIDMTPHIYIPCLVAQVGEPVTLLDYSNHQYNNLEFWRWYFDWNNNTNDKSNMYYKINGYYVNPSDLQIQHTYYTQGKKVIKLQTYNSCTATFPSLYCDERCIINGTKYWVNEFKDIWAGLYVVDCNLTATPVPIGVAPCSYSFANAVYNEESSSPYRFYAGSFWFDGRLNSKLNAYDWTLTACNEITIDGNIEFIVNGAHELILETGTIPDCSLYSFVNSENEENKRQDTIIAVKNNSIDIFPNPCVEFLNIKIDLIHTMSVNFFITDILGTTINRYNFENIEHGSQILKINIKELQAGIYFFKSDIENCNKALKFVKTY